MDSVEKVAIGLGSNLGEPVSQISQAVRSLSELPMTRVVAASGLYSSPPLGPQDQPDYVNAVVLLETGLAPLELLDRLQAIEQAQGRVRGAARWGPRTLDLDVLIWGQKVMDHPRLRVPHPGLHERAFVLYPLAEIDPGIQVPGRGDVGVLLSTCASTGLVRVQDPPLVVHVNASQGS